ncbi:MAG: D-aminoacylase, partial [Xanthomonadales bacterium]|nr:D-aminoacylase [Xanthomonadales bacterium]
TAPDLPRADVDSRLIANVRIVDGSGAPAEAGAVRIRNGLIAERGLLEPLPGETVVDGGGRVLAPGFIDTHSHADRDLFEQPGALAAVSQGITTAVIGQDGDSPFPLLDFRFRLIEQPAAINVAAYSGHNTLREQVMGEDFRRTATETELHQMAQLLERDLEAGALGLAAGLEYDPGIYSNTIEVTALARVAAAQGGRYISHIRSEDRWFEQALDEIIAIGQAADLPVQISHLKLAMTRLWGRAPEILERLDAARAAGVDVTADVYPYEYWQSDMMVLLPERNITDREEVEFMLREIAPPDGMWFTRYHPQPGYVGKTLAAVAAERGTDPATAFMELIAASEAMRAETGRQADKIIGTSMHPDDVAALILWPHSNICTDGALTDLHPRGAGAFTRVLGRYVREEGLLSLEDAVRKMTALAADHMGLADRGRIQPGLAADLVLFDPDTVIDIATPQDPGALSSGIEKVWVNGVVVYDNGRETGARPGRFLARQNGE